MTPVGSRRARELGDHRQVHGGTSDTVAGDGDNKATNRKGMRRARGSPVELTDRAGHRWLD